MIMRGFQYMNKRTAFKNVATLALLSPCFVQANSAIEMHFFADEPAELIVANSSVENNEPKMQMVIFTADEEQAGSDASYYEEEDSYSFSYYLDSSYQQDSVSWSVASPTGRPDTLTEMQWDNLSMMGVDVGFKAEMPYNLVLKGDAGYAWEISGDSRQVFYARDGKTQPFSDISGDTEKSYSWHGSFALGYALDFGLSDNSPVSFNLTPLVGYAWREQNLKSNHGQQRLEEFNPVDPESLDQQNSYSTSWYGPWLGADLTLIAFKKHQLFSSFQHHWADYKAEGHWRQSQDLQQPKSFEHEADATGVVASAGYRYLTDDDWGLSISVDYQNWNAESGSETLYTNNDEQFNSQLNEVDWESVGVNLGVNVRF